MEKMEFKPTLLTSKKPITRRVLIEEFKAWLEEVPASAPLEMGYYYDPASDLCALVVSYHGQRQAALPAVEEDSKAA